VLPLSTKDLVPYTPDSLKDREDKPTFLLKVPTLRDKITIDYEVAAAGVRYPNNAEYAKALRAAVLEHVIYNDQPALLQFIEELDAAGEEGRPAGEEVDERIEEIARALRPIDRELGKIQGDRVRFLETAFLVRAELCLMGIEGLDAPPVERRSGKLTDECMEQIERRYGAGTISLIGGQVASLSNPTDEQRKNSPSPAASPAGPEISTAALPPPTARRGKSSGNGTSETHV